MADAIPFAGANTIYKAPDGRDDVCDLHTFGNGHAIVSAWKLGPEELAEVNRNGGVVFLSVLSGKVLFPVFVGSEASVRSVVADYGPVWKRETAANPSASEVHNELAPALLQSLIRSAPKESDSMIILESLTFGVLKFFCRERVDIAGAMLDALKSRVIERLSETEAA